MKTCLPVWRLTCVVSHPGQHRRRVHRFPFTESQLSEQALQAEKQIDAVSGKIRLAVRLSGEGKDDLAEHRDSEVGLEQGVDVGSAADMEQGYAGARSSETARVGGRHGG